MAFPNTPLDIRTELLLSGVWTDISADVYVRDPKEIDQGRRDMGARTDPGKLTLTFNNRDGRYSPRNPMSPLYELIGRNTPVRVSVPGTVHYLELSGHTDTYVSTPDAAALDITGDLDLRVELETNWYGPTNQMLLGKWDVTTNQRSYMLRLQNGILYLHYTTDGTAAGGFFHGRYLPALPKRAALRATLDINNGTGGRTARFYWAESIDADEWTQIRTDSTLTGIVALHSGTAPLSIAPTDLTQATPRVPVEGKVYAAQVRNGIGGTVVAAPDFEAEPVGAAAFTDAVGRLWSYSGTAAVSDRAHRYIGEISTWPKKWQPDGSDIWTPVEASGVLRRYDQGAKALNSTLRRRIPSGNPSAYWPMEEDSLASRAYSPVPGVSPAAMTGVEWAAVDTLPSSKALPQLGAAATLSAIVPSTANDGEWQVEFVYNADDKTPPDPGPHAELISISTTGTIRRWWVGMRAGAVRLFGYNASGTAVVNVLMGVGGDVFHGWVRLRLWCRDEGGGQMAYRVDFQDVGGDAGGTGATITAAAGRVTAITANWGPLTEGWAFGHLSVLPTASNTLYTGSDRAYSGENAWQRLLRLASEEGIPMGRVAGPLELERVGPQRPDTLLELLHSAAEADGGILIEDHDRLGLVYRDRSSMYTQEPALTLVYGQPGLGVDLEPLDDDTSSRNDITVKRSGGSEGRAVLEEGKLSVQAPPAGIGVYDEAPELSLDDDTQTEPVACWRLHLGTYDGDRYPAVTVMLHKPGAQHLIPAVLGLRLGDVIRLKNLPPWVSFDDVDLIVQGYHETLDLQRWEVTFNCSSGGPWNTAKASHTVYGKANTTGHELAAAVTANAAVLPVVATAGLPWVSANPILNANSDFKDGLAPWAPFDSAIERIAKPAGAPFRGDWVLQITPNGIGQFPNAGSEMIPVVPGLDYVLSGWLHCAVARNVALNVNWFDAGFGYEDTGANDIGVQAGVWKWFEKTFTAMPGWVWANLSPTVPNFPPSSDVLLAGKVTFRRAGGMPREFPIDIRVGGEVMAVNAVTPSLVDSFARTTSPGWGTPDIGAAWVSSGGAGGDHYTQGAEAAHLLTAVDVPRLDLSPVAGTDHDVVVSVATFALATGGPQLVAVVARATDGDNAYMAQLSVSTTQTITLTLRKRMGGAETQLATVVTTLAHSAFAFFRVRLQVIGAELKARVWPAGGTEPVGWQVTATDSSLTTGGNVGCRSVRQTANTNAGLVVAWDSVQLLNPQAVNVARSQNRVIKPHTSGAPVRLAFPAITSL
ncbi:hypothetical protein FHS35_009100 [Streptomyces umbrinus]|uniref:hypothetical protein n=1 Tax=Streptomyces umbrinus TaxID=67370 RepID=UPI00214DE4D9|nr:hypothetical protein [Streptomyces umbrinus]MCR3732182.1 hypothetical protein [Streptomyces umbrinus]